MNEAFRIEALTKTLGRPILLSPRLHSFWAAAASVSARHLLKGVGEPAEIFALA